MIDERRLGKFKEFVEQELKTSQCWVLAWETSWPEFAKSEFRFRVRELFPACQFLWPDSLDSDWMFQLGTDNE